MSKNCNNRAICSGYFKQGGLVPAPNNGRARIQQAARNLAPLNLASLN